MTTKPGYLFQLSQQIGQDKQLSVHGNFAEGATVGEMTVELDKIFEALEIQNMKRMKLPAVEGELRDQKDRLKQAKEDERKLIMKEQANRLTTPEKGQLENLRSTIEFLEGKAIPKGEEILAEMKKMAA